jgi:hypothetical protein
MAATYTLLAQNVTMVAGKNMLAWQNHTGSSVVIDTYRIWFFNINTAANNGNPGIIELWTYTSVASFTGGTAVTFIKQDTNSATVPSQVIANTATSTVLTRNSRIKRFYRWGEEVIVSGAIAVGQIQTAFPPLNLMQDSGYAETNIQPLRLRPGEGLVLFTPSSGGGTYVGQTDIVVECTVY